MRLTLSVLFFLAILPWAQAQQPAQYSLFALNPYAYNTASAGLDGSVQATGALRGQWLGLSGAPLTLGLNVHAPLDYLSSGIGIGVERDALGADRFLSVQLGYNYFVDLGQGRLSFGLAGRFWQRTLDGSLLQTPDGVYEGSNLNHNDAYLPLGKQSGQAYTLDASIFYRSPRFWAGVSARNLSEPTIDLQATLLESSKQTRAYFLMAGYRFDLNEDWALEPTALLKTDLVKWQPEAQVWLHYRKQFFGALGYRGYSAWTQDAVTVSAGLNFSKHYRLAYAYDFSLSALRGSQSGSHELVLQYNLQEPLAKEVPPKIIYNPRYLGN